ncbi:MAG: PH domain-containing protein [Propioniciclava sp.]|uniref:PH domain-containing protein n=1 Tax=Propioniciclava sp. TaxID=2038686 RepID=UPI0039E54394
MPAVNHTWEAQAHPHLLRRQASVWTIVLGGGAVFGWFALPANVRVLFTELQVATLAFFVLVMLSIVWSLALGYVKAGPDGLLFRNGLRTRHLPWSEVVGVRYNRADHWAFVELSDDSDRPLLGIQRSDGPLADEMFAQLDAVVTKYAGR